MKISEQWLFYGEAFLRLFYPAACGVCRAPLELNEQGICSTCRGQVERMSYSPDEAVLVDRFESVDEAWGLFPYESPIKELIAAIKFMKKRWLVRTFDEAIRHASSVLTAETCYDALVPIPLSLQNLMAREFNQAELIARRLSESSKLPVASNLLKKRMHIPEQSRLHRKERKANPLGVFKTGKTSAIRGKSFLLVDDVVTTGATAEEAARILKLQGAKRVDLFALARTPRTA
jgi:ComF family protein